jgi:hypothetical protein
MGFLYDMKMDNLDPELDRIANSDNEDEHFFLLVENGEGSDKGGYEVFIGKPGALERMKGKAVAQWESALD